MHSYQTDARNYLCALTAHVGWIEQYLIATRTQNYRELGVS